MAVARPRQHLRGEIRRGAAERVALARPVDPFLAETKVGDPNVPTQV